MVRGTSTFLLPTKSTVYNNKMVSIATHKQLRFDLRRSMVVLTSILRPNNSPCFVLLPLETATSDDELACCVRQIHHTRVIYGLVQAHDEVMDCV